MGRSMGMNDFFDVIDVNGNGMIEESEILASIFLSSLAQRTRKKWRFAGFTPSASISSRERWLATNAPGMNGTISRQTFRKTICRRLRSLKSWWTPAANTRKNARQPWRKRRRWKGTRSSWKSWGGKLTNFDGVCLYLPGSL